MPAPSLGNHNGDAEGSYRWKTCSPLVSHRYPAMRPRVSPPYRKRDGNGNVKCPSIEFLPDECLSEILKRLSGARERSSSACVSKRWLSLLSNIHVSDFCIQVAGTYEEIIKKDFDKYNITSLSDEEEVEEEILYDGYPERTLVTTYATDIALAGMAVGTARRGGLGKLSIRGSSKLRVVTNYGLSAIGHGCPMLKNLLLFDISTIGDDGLKEIARGCPLLEIIDLCRCPTLTDQGLVAIANNCPNLTTFNIDSCSNIGNMSLQAIGRYCSKIQSVAIKNCPLIGNQGVLDLLSSASAVLTSLKLQLLDIDDFSITVIGRFGLALRSLELCKLRYISQHGFLSLHKCRCLQLLESLTLNLCGVTDSSLQTVGEACPKLKHMVLIKCCFLLDAGLVAFTRAARSLESLQLEECHMITQTGLICALSLCTSRFMNSLSIIECLGVIMCPPQPYNMSSPSQSLRFLSILSSPGFTGNNLVTLGNLCPGLHKLDFTGLTELTDEALKPFITSLEPRFVEVNLRRCVNLTDKPIVALVKTHGQTLKLLNLEGCKKVTDVSMVAIAHYCHFMCNLDVSECSITDEGLSAVCDELYPNFHTLSVAGCSAISDNNLHFIKMMLYTLCRLNIQKCKSLSEEGIKRLRKKLRRCDILS